jgi:phage terminase Nu1 subunit (DNA packaging protein)
MGFSHTRLPIQPVPDGDVVGLPVREVEPYITAQELADLMGISVRQVHRLKARGMPYENWGMRVVRFKASVALAWVRSQGGQTA